MASKGMNSVPPKKNSFYIMFLFSSHEYGMIVTQKKKISLKQKTFFLLAHVNTSNRSDRTYLLKFIFGNLYLEEIHKYCLMSNG